MGNGTAVHTVSTRAHPRLYLPRPRSGRPCHPLFSRVSLPHFGPLCGPAKKPFLEKKPTSKWVRFANRQPSPQKNQKIQTSVTFAGNSTRASAPLKWVRFTNCSLSEKEIPKKREICHSRTSEPRFLIGVYPCSSAAFKIAQPAPPKSPPKPRPRSPPTHSPHYSTSPQPTQSRSYPPSN